MIVRYGIGLVLVLTACSDRRTDGQTDRRTEGQPVAGTVLPGNQRDERAAIVFLGTSLTAGNGLRNPDSEAYPAILQAKLDSAGRPFRVVNAGVSGESSAGALSRIDWLLTHDSVAVLVVETGANDALRGQDPDSVRARLDAILARALRAPPPPSLVVLGMEALPNLGEEYGQRFRALYPEVARTYRAMLVPFLLAGVGGVDSLNQDDGIHPTAAGHRKMAENVWPVLERVTR